MNQRVRHAKAYPFPQPDSSYLYHGGEIRDLDHAVIDRNRRVPVLAAGSNQSHEQIHRKYSVLEGDTVVIPAQRGRLADFDVVYAAHLSSYGSVPATFQASPGTEVVVFVLWLDEPQLARMHATEGNYTYDHLSGIRVALDDGGQEITEAYAYSSKIGCFNHEGACLSLAEIDAAGRRFAAARQPDVLGHVRDRFAPETELDAFIHEHIEDRDVHRERSQALGRDALPLAFRRSVIERL